MFYLLAALAVVALIILGVISSRKSATESETNDGGSFNVDQLQDAEQKAPAAN